MSELDRILARGPIPKVACQTLDEWHHERFQEECRWAVWVDDLEAEANRLWQEALRVRAAWACAVCGWAAAIVITALWWRATHG